MQDTAYGNYLRLAELLALQHPRTPARGSAQWVDERFFIVVHQSSELLAGHALAELRRAATPSGGMRRVREVIASVRRVGGLLELLEAHLALLDHLDTAGFAAFRPLLGEASGGQSIQLAELFRLIGGAPDCGIDSASLRDLEADATAWEELAAALSALRAALTRWKTRHLLLVERMIGSNEGTDGTSGLAYLHDRIALPPRTVIHRHDLST